MLLDDVMPVFDFRSRHDIVVDAAGAAVADAIETYRLDESPIVRILFRLRGLGAAPGTLREALGSGGFVLLAEAPGQEIVLGTAGWFWAVDERAHLIRPRDAREFRAFAVPGAAKATLSLHVEPLSAGRTRLRTETRVACVDAAARRRFALYWSIIKPFSGWIRGELLRGIARHALAADAAMEAHRCMAR